MPLAREILRPRSTRELAAEQESASALSKNEESAIRSELELAKVPPDDIEKILADMRGAESAPSGTDVPGMEAAGRSPGRYALDVLEPIAAMIPGEAAGAAMRPLASKAIGSLALRKGLLPWAGRTAASLAVPAARAVGTTLGDVLISAADPRRDVDVRRSAGLGAMQFGLEAGLGQTGRGLARAGGVSPEAAAQAQAEGRLPYMKPRGAEPLLRPTSVKEFKGLASDVAEKVEGAGDIAGQPHEAYMKLVRQRGKTLIDAGPMMNTLRSEIKGAGVPPHSTADTFVRTAMADLRTKIRPGGVISIADADAWIRNNLTPGALKAERMTSAGEAEWARRAESLRSKMVPYLYGKVSPTAAGALQSETRRLLTSRESVKTVLPEQTPYRLNLQTPRRLRQVMSETEAGQEVRDRLGGFDKDFGTTLLPEAQRLAMRESWKPLSESQLAGIVETLHPGGGPGFWLRAGRSLPRGVGKGLTKAARPSGRLLTAYEEWKRSQEAEP